MILTGRTTDRLPLFVAAAAVITGCLLLGALGAPLRMPLMNFAALLIGFAILAIIGIVRRAGLPAGAGDAAFLLLALSIAAPILFGESLEGVSRWIVVAGVTIQPASIAAPAVAVGLALRPSPARAAACVIAAAGIALQPDPAAAAMLFLGTAAPLAVRRRHMSSMSACAASGVALAIAVARTPSLPPVPFVEGVFARALAAGVLPTALALIGTAVALLPSVLTAGRHKAVAFAFAGAWGAALAASLIGPYPTPILGFGGSAILGYLLCAGLLTPGTATASAGSRRAGGTADEDSHQNLRFA